MHSPVDRAAHTTASDGPVVDHWLGRKIAKTANALTMQAHSDDPKPLQASVQPPELYFTLMVYNVHHSHSQSAAMMMMMMMILI